MTEVETNDAVSSIAGIPSLSLRTEPPPLRIDSGGTIRIGKGRINLDLIVEQYENGMSPEDMVRAYDTLVLGEVYAAIGYFLLHREEVRAYLNERQKTAELVQRTIESERPRISRDELIARRNAKENAHASAGE